jgi:hypothetical protein
VGQSKQIKLLLIGKKMIEEISERKLSPAGRRAIARAAKRNAARNALARKRKQNRMANAEDIKNRARRAAVQTVTNRILAGRGGKSKSELSRSEKENLEKLVAKKAAVIDKIAKKLVPQVRKAEQERLAKRREKQEEE